MDNLLNIVYGLEVGTMRVHGWSTSYVPEPAEKVAPGEFGKREVLVLPCDCRAELTALIEAGDEAAQHEIPWKGKGWFSARAALTAKLEASR